MSEVVVLVPTLKNGMSEIRPALEAIFEREFPSGILEHTWDGETVRLSGPGAVGTIVYRDGQLIAQANLRPPASLLKPVIQQKMTEALREAAGSAPPAV